MDDEPQGTPAPGEGRFATTHWSVVLAAACDRDTLAQEALAKLCQSYWYPLYVFVRRQGCNPQDAEDLTQEFFARLLAKHYLKAVDRSKGRFRSFVLAALKHFLANEWARARRLKHGGGQTLVALDALWAEGQYGREPADTLVLFERDYQRLVESRNKDKRSRHINSVRVDSLACNSPGTRVAAWGHYAGRTMRLPVPGSTNLTGTGARAGGWDRRWPWGPWESADGLQLLPASPWSSSRPYSLLVERDQVRKELERFGVLSPRGRKPLIGYAFSTMGLVVVVSGSPLLLGLLSYLRTRQFRRGQRPAPALRLAMVGVGLALGIYGLALASQAVAAFVWEGLLMACIVLLPTWLALLLASHVLWKACLEHESELSGVVLEEKQIETPWFVWALLLAGMALIEVPAFPLEGAEMVAPNSMGLLLGVPLGYTAVTFLVHRAKKRTCWFGGGSLLLLALGVVAGVLYFPAQVLLEERLLFPSRDLFLSQVLVGGVGGWLLACVLFRDARRVTDQLLHGLEARLTRR